MTRGQIVFELSRTIGLDDTPGSDELILMQGWVNAGIKDVLVKTRCRLDEGDMTLTGGVTDYRIDDALLAADMAVISDDIGPRRMTSVSNDTINDILLRTSVTVGEFPLYFYGRGDFFRVAPPPPDGTVVRVFYVPKPTEIPADGTTHDDQADLANGTYGGIPEEYHDAVQAYCLWAGAQYDDKGGGFYRGHAFAPGSAYQAVYQDRVKEIRRELRGKTARGMHGGRVGYPDRYGIPRRNDVDYGWR